MPIPLISQTMRPALRPRHTSRFLSARRVGATRSTWRSYGLEHQRRLSTSQPGRGSGGSGEVGDLRESIIPLCYALLDTHCVNPFLLLAAKTVGRQNGCRVSEPAGPCLALAMYPSRTSEPDNVSSACGGLTSGGVHVAEPLTATLSGRRRDVSFYIT